MNNKFVIQTLDMHTLLVGRQRPGKCLSQQTHMQRVRQPRINGMVYKMITVLNTDDITSYILISL